VRRSDKEIESRTEIDAVIRSAEVCRLAFADDDEPYLVPISFGYDGVALYIHTAKTGRKIDFIERNSRVCFEFENNVKLRGDAGDACEWTFEFECVIGYGAVAELTNDADKARGLNEIMKHYSGREWVIEPPHLTTTRVWRITIDSVTGKRSSEKPPPTHPIPDA
jgi:nitroimidazol reductase NimA-like FMN-containing flavoprotein (pyridoxamine 5'-phosphate oxidase superfamily)